MILRPVYVFLRLLPFIVSFMRDFRSGLFFGAPVVRTEDDHRRRAKAMTAAIAELGPTFIKGIQVLAMREDLIPPIYTSEFKMLQDRVPPFPAERAMAIIRDSLGRQAEELLQDFDKEPIAAASLGQVHKARYRGQTVAVKVLRPNVERMVAADLAVLHFLIGAFNLFIDSYLIRNFKGILKEFTRVIREELDFRTEYRNAERWRRNLTHLPGVIVPKGFEELSSARTAVFQFIDGCRVDDLEGLRARGISPANLLNTIIETYVHMVLVDGFLHADPHPGNLLVDAEGRLVILDYGMAVEIDPQTKLEMLRIVYCVVREDVQGIVDGFYRLGMVDPDINPTAMRDAARVLMQIQLRSDYSIRQIQEIAEDILRTFYKFPLRLPQELVYLLRASALVEGIGLAYDPKFNAVKTATPIVSRMLRDIPLAGDKGSWKDRIFKVGADIIDWAGDLKRVVSRLERDQLRMRIHPRDIAELESFMSAALRRLLICIGAVGLALWGAVLYTRYQSIWWMLGSATLAVILFTLAISIPLRRRIGGYYRD